MENDVRLTRMALPVGIKGFTAASSGSAAIRIGQAGCPATVEGFLKAVVAATSSSSRSAAYRWTVSWLTERDSFSRF